MYFVPFLNESFKMKALHCFFFLTTIICFWCFYKFLHCAYFDKFFYPNVNMHYSGCYIPQCNTDNNRNLPFPQIHAVHVFPLMFLIAQKNILNHFIFKTFMTRTEVPESRSLCRKHSKIGEPNDYSLNGHFFFTPIL